MISLDRLIWGGLRALFRQTRDDELPVRSRGPDARRHLEKPEKVIVQELCESRGGRPELSVLTSLLVSVDVKNY